MQFEQFLHEKHSLQSTQSRQFLQFTQFVQFTQFTQLMLPFSSATRLAAIVVAVWFVMAFSPKRLVGVACPNGLLHAEELTKTVVHSVVMRVT